MKELRRKQRLWVKIKKKITARCSQNRYKRLPKLGISVKYDTVGIGGRFLRKIFFVY